MAVRCSSRRCWEKKYVAVNSGAVTAGAEDVGCLILREFALIYGNDWFQFPLAVPAGCQVKITSLKVADTFGISTAIHSGSSVFAFVIPLHASVAFDVMGSPTVCLRFGCRLCPWQAREHRRIMATCGDQHETVPDRIVKPQALPTI